MVADLVFCQRLPTALQQQNVIRGRYLKTGHASASFRLFISKQHQSAEHSKNRAANGQILTVIAG
jgi:hypothetical protein